MVIMGRKAVVIYHIRSRPSLTTTDRDDYITSNFITSAQRMSMLWIRRLISSRLLLRLGSDPRSVCVGFVVDKVAVGEATLRVPYPSLSINDVVRSTMGSPTLKTTLLYVTRHTAPRHGRTGFGMWWAGWARPCNGELFIAYVGEGIANFLIASKKIFNLFSVIQGLSLFFVVVFFFFLFFFFFFFFFYFILFFYFLYINKHYHDIFKQPLWFVSWVMYRASFNMVPLRHSCL